MSAIFLGLSVWIWMEISWEQDFLVYAYFCQVAYHYYLASNILTLVFLCDLQVSDELQNPWGAPIGDEDVKEKVNIYNSEMYMITTMLRKLWFGKLSLITCQLCL